jgi:hypothetical protein
MFSPQFAKQGYMFAKHRPSKNCKSLEPVVGRFTKIDNAAGDKRVGAQPYAEPRRSPHYFWTAPVVIRSDKGRYVGLVRDVSSDGIGIYSNFNPDPGSRVELEIRVRRSTATVCCSGKVVRAVADKSHATMIGIVLEDFYINGTGHEKHWSTITDALRELPEGSESELQMGHQGADLWDVSILKMESD